MIYLWQNGHASPKETQCGTARVTEEISNYIITLQWPEYQNFGNREGV